MVPREDDADGTEDTGDAEVTVVEDEGEVGYPGKFAVILHNDNYTTMEFVVEVLKKIFRKSHPEATAVMLKIHNEGRGVAGIYPFDIAETKAAQVTELARIRGFPLKCTIEPEKGEGGS